MDLLIHTIEGEYILPPADVQRLFDQAEVEDAQRVLHDAITYLSELAHPDQADEDAGAILLAAMRRLL